MRLKELKNGDKLHVIVYLKKGRLEFDTQIIHQDSFGSVIKLIHHGNKIVNFSIPDIRIELNYVQSNGKPIIWSECQIRTVLFKGKQIQIASTDVEGVERNRREAFRMGMGVDGTVKIGNRPEQPVFINDVSYYGFGIVLKDDLKDSLREKVRLVFSDEGMDLELEGVIVRKMQRPDDQMHYGCKLEGANSELTKLISLKQRKRVHVGK